MNVTESYPLQWPAGWPRNQRPEFSRFAPDSIHGESLNVMRQLQMMGATGIVISSNMQYRNDGLPYTRQNVTDTGVAVYFNLNDKQQCIPCDRWVKLEENLRAIAKTIDALRGIERWGAKEMVDAAFSGFKALPASGETGAAAIISQDWADILEVSRNASPEAIKASYRRLAHIHHPDKGGDSTIFQRINAAYQEALKTGKANR